MKQHYPQWVRRNLRSRVQGPVDSLQCHGGSYNSIAEPITSFVYCNAPFLSLTSLSLLLLSTTLRSRKVQEAISVDTSCATIHVFHSAIPMDDDAVTVAAIRLCAARTHTSAPKPPTVAVDVTMSLIAKMDATLSAIELVSTNIVNFASILIFSYQSSRRLQMLCYT